MDEASTEMDRQDVHLERRFAAVSRSTTFRNILDILGLREKAVLDIGCSYGEFLAHFGEKSVGLTITPAEAAYGKVKGLDIRLGNIEEDPANLPEHFDAIFANNIFEHLYSPHEFLFRVKRYLKPEGILILGVPCVPKITALLRVKKFRGSLATQHINFFTRDTLRLTVERAGWSVQEVRGFHFKNSLADGLFNLVYPHFYVVASVDPNFAYSDKRLKELAGYKDVVGVTEAK